VASKDGTTDRIARYTLLEALVRPTPEIGGGGTKAELIWASPLKLDNVFHTDSIGCHIITATNDILKKLELIGKNLDEYSLDTVKMFYQDAKAAGFSI